MICRQKLYRTMDELGYREAMKGTEYIRLGVEMVDKDRRAMMCKDIYPGIAKATGDSPVRIERAMRAATAAAQRNPLWSMSWREIGGWNDPTNAEVIRRLARECQSEN